MDKSQEELIISLIGYGNLLLAFLNVYLAHRKGRKKVLWFFLTLLFSVFATIMLLLADKDENGSAEQANT